MSLWLLRSHKDHSYWDVASANFKHAIGLSCELVVEHIQSFLHSGSYRARACPCGHGFSRQHHTVKVLRESLVQDTAPSSRSSVAAHKKREGLFKYTAFKNLHGQSMQRWESLLFVLLHLKKANKRNRT